MDYRKFGECYYIRMDRDDEIISTILEICKKENIRSATFSGIGGCKNAEIQTFTPETGSFEEQRISGMLELVKILVHLVTKGSMTAGVGDVANFIFGCTFAVPAGLIYRYKSVKSRKHAVIGMAVGTVLTAVVACFINAFVLLPAYGKAFGMPVEAFIEMGSAVHSSVNNLLTFAAMIIFPFNIFKYALTSLIVFLIYKRIRVVLKGD